MSDAPRPPFGTTVPGNAWDDVAPAAPRPVAVVLTHYRQPRELARTLAALARQTHPPYEIVVADDGSPQPPDLPEGVGWVTQPDAGFRAARVRNLAAASTTADVLVFLDADTTPEPSYVERIAAVPSALPEALVTGRRRHADLAAAPPHEPVERAGPARELPEPRWLREAHARTGQLREAGVAGHRYVVGAVMATSRWWFELIGGFDERYDVYGGEDWELAHRSWLAGGLLAHVPGAVAWHDGPSADQVPRAAPDAAADAAGTDARTGETLRAAARIGAPGTGWRGLWGGPADVVVTLDPELARDRRRASIALDAAVAALPTARLVLPPGPGPAAWFADEPRLLPAMPATARVEVHLSGVVLGEPALWREQIERVDADQLAELALVPDGGDPASPPLRVRDLRHQRRAARWPARADRLLRHRTVSVPGLRAADDVSLAAWLGGWA